MYSCTGAQPLHHLTLFMTLFMTLIIMSGDATG